MSSSKREFEPIKLFIKLKFILPGTKGIFGNTESISLYLNETLNEQFKSFVLNNKIKCKKDYYFYLIKGKDILKRLPKKAIVKNLNLQSNDIILVSYNKNLTVSNIETTEERIINEPIIYPTEKPKINKRNKKKIIIALIIIFFLLVLTGLLNLVLYLIKKRKKRNEPDIPIFNKDKLVVKKNYPINMILRYSNKKETEMKLEGEKIPKKDSSQGLWMTSDFIFIVRDEKVEKDELKLSEKNVFTGYIAFLNLTSHNKTDDMMIIYDKTLNKILSNNSLRNLDEPDLKYIGEDGNFCFAKIEFYLNGDIKNYYLFKGMSKTEFNFIEEISKLIIPKISLDLYIKSIDQYLSDLSKNETENNNNISEFEIRRILNSNKKRIFEKRILDDKSENIKDYDIDDEEVVIEEYITTPLTPSFNYDLREAKEINESSVENNNEKKGNYSNLTQYSLKTAECEDFKMEGSNVNTTTHSIINDKGLLESVEQEVISVMETQNMNGNDRETDLLYSQVYDDNNQISYIDNQEINNDSNQNQNVDPGISRLSIISSQTINLSDYFTNEEINKKIYSYFDNFTYEKYNESNFDSKLENI